MPASSDKKNIPIKLKETNFELNPLIEKYLKDPRETLNLKELSKGELDIDRVLGLLEDMLPPELADLIKSAPKLLKKLAELGKSLPEFLQKILSLVPQQLKLEDLLRLVNITDIDSLLGPILKEFDFRSILPGMEGLFGNSISELKGLNSFTGISNITPSTYSNSNLPALAVGIARVNYDSNNTSNPFTYTNYPNSLNNALLTVSKSTTNISPVISAVKNNKSNLLIIKTLSDTNIPINKIKNVLNTNVDTAVVTSLTAISTKPNCVDVATLIKLTPYNNILDTTTNAICGNLTTLSTCDLHTVYILSDTIKNISSTNTDVKEVFITVRDICDTNNIPVNTTLLDTLNTIKHDGMIAYLKTNSLPLILKNLIDIYGLDTLIGIINTFILIGVENTIKLIDTPVNLIDEFISNFITKDGSGLNSVSLNTITGILQNTQYSKLLTIMNLLNNGISLTDINNINSSLNGIDRITILNLIKSLDDVDVNILLNSYDDLINLNDTDINNVEVLLKSLYNVSILNTFTLDKKLYEYIVKRILLGYSKVGNVIAITILLKNCGVSIDPLYRKYILTKALKHYTYTDEEKLIDPYIFSNIFVNMLHYIYSMWDVDNFHRIDHGVISTCSNDVMTVLSNSKTHYQMYVVNNLYRK